MAFGPGNRIVVKDTWVSWQHCRFFVNDMSQVNTKIRQVNVQVAINEFVNKRSDFKWEHTQKGTLCLLTLRT